MNLYFYYFKAFSCSIHTNIHLYIFIFLFNRCEEIGSFLVTLECWNNVHPAFKTIPLDSGETTPYGILYSKTPTDDALKFIEIIKDTIEK